MSGTMDDAIHIRVIYYDPWTWDDAERLVKDPMLEAMAKACEEIATKYANPSLKVIIT